jgi:hypothetical protein
MQKEKEKEKEKDATDDIDNEVGCGLFEDEDEWNDRLKHWKGARVIMKTYLKRANLKSAGDVCLWILKQTQFGSMSTVVKLALFLTLVPPTSVPVERGFSIRNQIKTILKNRMLVDLLSAMMLINVETGKVLDRKIARRASEIWLFEEGIKRRNLMALKFEIEKEHQKLMEIIREEKGNNYNNGQEAEDFEIEEKIALDIVIENEKIKQTLKH